MADEIDLAQEHEQYTTQAAIADVLNKGQLEPGTPGECDLCGEHSGRLIRGACAPCRDYYLLP